MTTFSVILCTYNYAHFLGQALGSVAAQSFRDFEVLVVDDGSTDATADVAAAWRQRLPGFRYLPLAHGGLPATRNAGLREARGERIAFLDADDMWAPAYLANAAQVWSAKNPDLLMCNGYRVRANGRCMGYFAAVPPHIGDVMSLSQVTAPSSMIATRALFQRMGGFDDRFPIGNDVHWLARALRAGAAAHWEPKPLVLYRQHGSNLSASPGSNFAEWLRLSADLFLDGDASAAERASARAFTRRRLPQMLSRSSAADARQMLRLARQQFPGDRVLQAGYAATFVGGTWLLRQVWRAWRGTERWRAGVSVDLGWTPQRIFDVLDGHPGADGSGSA